jgi:hypothetical protein
MSSSFDPRSDYPRSGAGEAIGQFERDARVWEVPLLQLVSVDELGEYFIPFPTEIALKLDVTKPDSRLALEVQIAFRPKGDYVTVGLDEILADSRTLAANLTDSTVWLALLGNVGGSDVEIEDIIGTRATPENMVTEGNWGVTYEVDEACDGIRATLLLKSPNIDGHWMARARWVAQQPMSERDWQHARQNMRMTVQGGLGVHPLLMQRQIETYRAPEEQPT